MFWSLPEKGYDTSLKEKKRRKRTWWKRSFTDAKMDTLQNYFGITLRQNVGDIN